MDKIGRTEGYDGPITNNKDYVGTNEANKGTNSPTGPAVELDPKLSNLCEKIEKLEIQRGVHPPSQIDPELKLLDKPTESNIEMDSRCLKTDEEITKK